MTSLSNKTLCGLVATIFLLASCSLDTPQAPPNDNPWDPANPSAPRSPIGLSGQVLSETSLSLHWQDQSGNESGFIILEGSGDLRPDSLWVAIDTVAANVDSLTLENRLPATEYRYRVLAFNPAGTSTPPANVLFLNTANVVPTRPLNLRAIDRNGITVKLEWEDHSANEEKFVIESHIDFNPYHDVDSVAANTTECIIDSLDFRETYYFRVKAVNSFGIATSDIDVDYYPSWAPLTPPYNVNAQALSENDVEISWSDSNQTAEEFEIFLSTNDTLSFNWVRTFSEDVRSWRATQLRANTNYYFKVQAKNRLVRSHRSAFAHASTAETVPWPPSNFSATVDNELDVILNWRDNSGIETGYRFELSGYDDFRFAISSTIPSSTTSTRINNFEGEGGNVYIRMCSVGEFGNSAWITAPVVTPGAFAPQPPSNLRGEAIDPTYIVMRWLDNSRIEVKFELSAKYGNNQWRTINFPNSNLEIVQVVNCLPSTSYTFRIRATNRYGSSNWVQSPIVTTPGPPQAPSNFSAEGVSSSQIDLNWAIMGATHMGFILEDSLYGAETWSFVDSIKIPAARSYQHGNAPRHQVTFYRLKSYNQYGNSGFSNIDSAMPYAKVAYVACNDAGIVAVDVTDPANPSEISRLDTPGLALRAEIESNNLYLADSYGGLSSFDISSPALMHLVGTYETESRAYNVSVLGGFAYTAIGDSGLAILSVSSRSEPPVYLSKMPTLPGIARGAVCINSHLYIAAQDRGVMKVNVGNRRSPSLITESASPASSQGICADNRGERIVVAEYSAGLRVLDNDDLAEIEIIPMDGNTYDVVQGDSPNNTYFYTADFNGGISVVSLIPGSSSVLATIGMPDNVWDIGILGSSLVFAAVDNAGLKIIDITNPGSPSVVGTFQTPGPARGVAIREYR